MTPMSSDVREQIRRALLVDARPDTVGVDGTATAIMALLEPALREERIKALREARDLAKLRTLPPEHCEHGYTEWDTNAWVCTHDLKNKDCLCAVRAEGAEGVRDLIAALIKKETAP